MEPKRNTSVEWKESSFLDGDLPATEPVQTDAETAQFDDLAQLLAYWMARETRVAEQIKSAVAPLESEIESVRASFQDEQVEIDREVKKLRAELRRMMIDGGLNNVDRSGLELRISKHSKWMMVSESALYASLVSAGVLDQAQRVSLDLAVVKELIKAGAEVVGYEPVVDPRFEVRVHIPYALPEDVEPDALADVDSVLDAGESLAIGEESEPAPADDEQHLDDLPF